MSRVQSRINPYFRISIIHNSVFRIRILYSVFRIPYSVSVFRILYPYSVSVFYRHPCARDAGYCTRSSHETSPPSILIGSQARQLAPRGVRAVNFGEVYKTIKFLSHISHRKKSNAFVTFLGVGQPEIVYTARQTAKETCKE